MYGESGADEGVVAYGEGTEEGGRVGPTTAGSTEGPMRGSGLVGGVGSDIVGALGPGIVEAGRDGECGIVVVTLLGTSGDGLAVEVAIPSTSIGSLSIL